MQIHLTVKPQFNLCNNYALRITHYEFRVSDKPQFILTLQIKKHIMYYICMIKFREIRQEYNRSVKRL